MNEREGETNRGFEICCVACGVKIRRDMVTDSPRVCIKCFYRILNERLCTQRRTRAGEGVSER
jgi:hypothetical protein